MIAPQGWYTDLWRSALRDPDLTWRGGWDSFAAKLTVVGVNLLVVLALFAGLLIGSEL